MGLFNASLEPDMAYLVNLRRGWTDTFSFPIVLKEARDGQGELENFSKAFLGGKFIYINPSNKGQGNHEYIHQTFRVRLVPRDGDVTLYRCRLGSGEYFISNQKDCESINTGLLVANDGVLGYLPHSDNPAFKYKIWRAKVGNHFKYEFKHESFESMPTVEQHPLEGKLASALVQRMTKGTYHHWANGQEAGWNKG